MTAFIETINGIDCILRNMTSFDVEHIPVRSEFSSESGGTIIYPVRTKRQIKVKVLCNGFYLDVLRHKFGHSGEFELRYIHRKTLSKSMIESDAVETGTFYADGFKYSPITSPEAYSPAWRGITIADGRGGYMDETGRGFYEAEFLLKEV